MIKNNKIKLIISSIIIILPMFVGLLLWDKLPEKMVVHFGINNEADGFTSKYFTVFGMPIVLLALQWLGTIVTAFDRKNKDQNKKIFGMVFWIVPLISVFANGVIYAYALGKNVDVGFFALVLLGLMFMVIGNYLPKCKQNNTIGIKLPWTLKDEIVWQKTHRLSGIVWVIGGIIVFASAFLPMDKFLFVPVAAILLMVIIPLVYSIAIYKRRG